MLWLVFMVFTCQLSAQLEFMQNDRTLFVGADSIEGKKIIAGVYVIPTDHESLRLEIDVMDNWVGKDSLLEQVTLDRKSVRKDKYFVTLNDTKYPAYRFANKSGLEILIEKEKFHESYDAYGICTRHWNISFAQIYLPQKRRSYVQTLPLMHQK